MPRRLGALAIGLAMASTIQAPSYADNNAVDEATGKAIAAIEALNHVTCGSLNKPGTVNADGAVIPGGMHYDFDTAEMKRAMDGMFMAGNTRDVSIPQPLTPYIASVCGLSQSTTTMLSVLQSIPGMEGWTGKWGEPLTAPVSKYQLVGQWELLGIRHNIIFKMDTGMVLPMPLHMGGGISIVMQGTAPGTVETGVYWLDCLGHYKTTVGETLEQMQQGQFGPLETVPNGSILNEVEQRICKYAPQE